MRIITICVALLMLLISPSIVSAQKIKIDGDLSILKGAAAVNVVYTYDSMSVGKFTNEQDYINEKKDEQNDKEPGKGDAWAKKWFTDRVDLYEPKFETLFTKESDIQISKTAKFTLLFKTTATEPGYNIGGGMFPGSRKNADINATILVVETANPAKVLVTITMTKVPGGTYGGFDFDTDTRIGECYAKAGKSLGKELK